jgi:hypothetical protein
MTGLVDMYLGMSLPTTTERQRARLEKVVNHILLANANVNAGHLEDHPELPFLYASGVLYAPPEQADGRPSIGWLRRQRLKSLLSDFEPGTIETVLGVLRGMETFYDTPRLYARKKGDCNELVPARLAELWREGVLAAPLLVKDQKPDGGYAYHALIQHPDGSSEDPSLILGMGGPQAADLRREECRKNAERYVMAKRAGKNPCALGYLPTNAQFPDPYKNGIWNGSR